MWMTRVAINNPVFATMVMVALCVLGVFSYQRLGVEQMPDVTIPVVSVEVAYPGASPAAVEVDITKPMENALNGIAGVKMIRSNSFEGYSWTVVEFTLDAKIDRALQDVRDRVGIVAASLPKEARTPRIVRMDNENSQQPLVAVVLQGEGRSKRELSLLADQTVRPALERAQGVARVQISGQTVREVRIDLSPDQLRAHAITPAQVRDALARANADAPVGRISNDASEMLVRIEGKVRDPKAFAGVVVQRTAAGIVTVGDLGTVVEREMEADSLSRINGQTAISFNVFRQQDANLVAAGDAVKEAIAALQNTLPAGVELRVLYASSDWVKDSLTGVQHTLIEGAILTVFIVFLFLHSWRSTIITGLTLPISVIASFIAVYALGFTLNFMTLMALSLCIGLLIDDAIVVRENIVRHLAMGKDHITAAREGTDEIGLAVMATTFAICAVFVPVAFMYGIVGKFFYPFGITVTVAVLVSLFVSFTLDPMLSAVWHEPADDPVKRWPVVRQLIAAVDGAMAVLHRTYDRLMVWVFSGRRWGWRWLALTPRGVVLWLAAASLVAALLLAGVVGAEGVPQTDQGYTQVKVTMPVGTSLARADAKVSQVEAVVRTLPEVENFTTQIGVEGSRAEAQIALVLKPRRERSRSQNQVEVALREKLAGIAGIDVSLGFNKPFYVGVLGPDPTVLDQITTDMSAKMRQIKGVADLETSLKAGLPAYAVRLKPDAARELGLTAADLASTLRTYVNGEVATYWTASDGQQIEVNLRVPESLRRHVEQLRTLPVAFAKDGTPMRLTQVADVVEVTNPEVIKRQDLQRRQGIYAGLDHASGRTMGDVGSDIQKLVASTTLPNGYRFDVGGATQDQDEMFGALLGALVLAVVFIYIVLASQFGSFVQPLAIMASLPLALIGVMLALLVSGSTINIFSLIGLIMLMGLVTKNAILLVDFANHARQAGATLEAALREAGQVRMRPIIMTTAAMVFGMLPLALAFNEGGEIQAPMGRAIIGGILTSTLLTLVVVPVIYSYLMRWRAAPHQG
ncbi:MAG: efflux RND transporter permease subunit [Proteobacteria bacterium]|nr:efflux RND transporter permease subunit [Pseudomonadota bacterium]